MVICVSLSRLHSFTTASFENSFILSCCLTITAVPLSVLSKTQLQKAFSLNAGTPKEVNSPATHRGVLHSAGAMKFRSAFFQCSVLDSYLLTSSSFSLSTAVSKIEVFLYKMVISLKNCRVEQKNHSFLAR